MVNIEDIKARERGDRWINTSHYSRPRAHANMSCDLRSSNTPVSALSLSVKVLMFILSPKKILPGGLSPLDPHQGKLASVYSPILLSLFWASNSADFALASPRFVAPFMYQNIRPGFKCPGDKGSPGHAKAQVAALVTRVAPAAKRGAEGVGVDAPTAAAPDREVADTNRA